VPPSTLRYYEEIGLIDSFSRHGLRRQYAPEVLQQLALISLGKMAGFPLSEMKGMFGKDGTADLPRPALHQRADQLDLQIRQLTTLSKALRHVAECPAETHLACPTFQRLMKAALNARKDKR
jgi:DNA-binding transcriptional MerR regulator